jgi:hypothetical protein
MGKILREEKQIDGCLDWGWEERGVTANGNQELGQR